MNRLARGVVAGIAGTAVMTAWQEAAAKLLPSDDSGSQGAKGDPWEEAPVPAQVARRLLRGVLHTDPPPERIPLLTNVMHWSYGTGWGIPYGVLLGPRRGSPVGRGLLFGALVWGSSYAELVPLGLYKPPWEYPPKDVALDVSYHLAYGVGVATAARLI